MNKLFLSILLLLTTISLQAQSAGRSMLAGEKADDYKEAIKLDEKQYVKWVELDEMYHEAVNKIVAEITDQKERAVAIRNQGLEREKLRKDMLKEKQIEAYNLYKAELKKTRRANQKKAYETYKEQEQATQEKKN